MSNLWLEILDTDTQISNNILMGIAEDFNNRIVSQKNKIRDEIAEGVVNLIRTTDTYLSLISGDLAKHFGLPIDDRQNMVDSIVQTVGNNLEIEHKIVKVRAGNFTGGVNIGVVIKDYSDILSMSEAIVTSEKGTDLPWLSWLLLSGDRIIISTHDVSFLTGKGRSGGAIMVKKSARAWRVPSEYSGSINANWLTRTFIENGQRYTNMISEILDRLI